MGRKQTGGEKTGRDPGSTGVVIDNFTLPPSPGTNKSGGMCKYLFHHANRAEKPLRMTEVNYAEVKYIILRKDGAEAWRETENAISALPLEFHSADRALADLATDIKSSNALSLADSFAAALAKNTASELITGDGEFQQLEKEIKIKWLK